MKIYIIFELALLAIMLVWHLPKITFYSLWIARLVMLLFLLKQKPVEPPHDMETTKLLAFQKQINPHFLYNILEGIRYEALIKGADTAANMSEHLAHFFQYSVSNLDKMVTIGDELHHLNTYFTIQKFRFEDRIHMRLIFEGKEETIKKRNMPKLILQPIVENAIQHGLEPLVRPGTVTIRLILFENMVKIVVSDDGIGMDEDKVSSLNTSVDDLSSIGIQNVSKRLNMIYGPNIGLRFFSKEKVGTDVEVTIPN
jgi:two-component system sensor histidine kinase YesM